MASLQRLKDGTRRIQFKHPVEGRATLRLGKVGKQAAENVKVHVERILAAGISGQPLDPSTAAWLAGLSPILHGRLVACHLVERKNHDDVAEPRKLGDFLKWTLDSKKHLKPFTRRNLASAARRLTDYFGDDRLIDSITKGDTDKWQSWLLSEGYRVADRTKPKKPFPGPSPKPKGLSVATVSRDVKRAKEFFESAVRHELITSNPFSHLKGGPQSNSSREFFITREMAAAVLTACPNCEWRAIFALSRFGGLRCPSEVLSLRWQDIDWSQERVFVTSPKTARYPGGESRVIPLFPELREVLAEAFEQAEPGAVHVIRRYRSREANLRTELQRILERAGLSSWPRLFHNLRASRETELAQDFPIHVVCRWIGNSVKVAQKHYLQVTDADYEKAAKATQKPTHHSVRRGCVGVRPGNQTAVSPAFSRDTAVQVPPAGIEPAT